MRVGTWTNYSAAIILPALEDLKARSHEALETLSDFGSSIEFYKKVNGPMPEEQWKNLTEYSFLVLKDLRDSALLLIQMHKAFKDAATHWNRQMEFVRENVCNDCGRKLGFYEAIK